MKSWMVIAAALIPAMAAAETVQSESLEAEMTRRPVAMTSDSGKAIKGEQVYVTMRRRDGQPIGTDDLETYVPFAERAACKGRGVMVSLIVGASDGAGRYEVLCAGQ
ncbi:hypothetical protein [Roseovarius salis]|uniref:hypothetical protein n=1 Tax=Roseovarius salis TaxID=3376063 RepID=UPI0037C7FB78